MKLMIASDIHGSAFYCHKLLEAFDLEEADKLLLLGDILYHGPRNPLPDGYDPQKVVAILNPRKNSILCVKGNCDTEVDQMVLDFPILSDYCSIMIGKRPIFATHGSQINRKLLPPLSTGEILLQGHTHIPSWEEFGDNNLCLNPGSVSLPKNGSERSYMVLEDDVITWKTLEGISYHTLNL